jgi:hypothetical protein
VGDADMEVVGDEVVSPFEARALLGAAAGSTPEACSGADACAADVFAARSS